MNTAWIYLNATWIHPYATWIHIHTTWIHVNTTWIHTNIYTYTHTLIIFKKVTTSLHHISGKFVPWECPVSPIPKFPAHTRSSDHTLSKEPPMTIKHSHLSMKITEVTTKLYHISAIFVPWECPVSPVQKFLGYVPY